MDEGGVHLLETGLAQSGKDAVLEGNWDVATVTRGTLVLRKFLSFVLNMCLRCLQRSSKDNGYLGLIQWRVLGWIYLVNNLHKTSPETEGMNKIKREEYIQRGEEV